MKESYVEGLASHGGPESCVCIREDAGEALTGVRAGRVLSREIFAPCSNARADRGVEAGPHRARSGCRKIGSWEDQKSDEEIQANPIL